MEYTAGLSMKDIPVILITYNRPWHTKQVLDSLRSHNVQNLFIFSDGPKSDADLQSVYETRSFFRDIDWTVPKVFEREKNIGLAKSIVSAVDYVFQDYDRLILLEDDCVPQKYFFDFMETCLDKYENNPKIFGIAGHTVSIPDEILRRYPYDSYFCPRIGSWGWATWKRAWKYHERDLSSAYQKAVANNIDLSIGGSDVPMMLAKMLNGSLKDVWTMNWILTVYLNGGRYIYPTVSHIDNIGMDGSGVHCGRTDKFVSRTSVNPPKRYPDDVVIDGDIYRNFRSYYDLGVSKPAPAARSNSCRILQIADHQQAGGASVAGYRLFTGLEKIAAEAKLVSFSDPTASQPGCYGFGSFIQKRNESNKPPEAISGQEWCGAVSSVLEKEQPNIINLHNIHEAIHRRGVPLEILDIMASRSQLVFTLHDMWLLTGRCAYSGNCAGFIDQSCNEQCSTASEYPQLVPLEIKKMLAWKKEFFSKNPGVVIVTPSRWLAEQVRQSHLKDHRIEVIPYGLDLSVYRPDPARESIRQSLGIDNDEFVVLAVAANLSDPRKGIQILVESLKHINGRLTLLVVGKSSIIANPPAHIRVINAGFINDPTKMARLYCAADLYVSPALEDNLPNTFIESIACGTPCLGFNVGGIPEIIRNGRTGWICPDISAEALAGSIQEIIQKPESALNLRRYCREVAESEYSLELQAQRYLSLYSELLSGRQQKNKYDLIINRNDNPKPIVQPLDQNGYLVSAIVSTYNAERFIRGCLEDLVEQSLFKQGQLEIVVINSGSEQNEESVVREFQQRYGNIVYIKTKNREGIYTAWNRGIRASVGRFVTNANTDDRHRADAFEVMAKTLLDNPEVGLVYGDQIRTNTANDTFAENHGVEVLERPQYSHQRLLLGCCVGSQPMWRNSLHEELGYFDESLACAADWDFWIRVSQKYRFQHIPKVSGLYYHNESGIEHTRKIHNLYERYVVGKRYGTEYIAVIPYCKATPADPLVSVIMPAHNRADCIGDAIESVLIQNYPKFELVIVDDGSTDNTREVILSYRDERIRYFHKQNGGPSSARNRALKEAKGRYIIPLDSDDMMLPNYILSHLQHLSKCPDADLIYCDDILINEHGRTLDIMKQREYSNRTEHIRDMFRMGHSVIPFRTFIKKSVFETIGLYDEGLMIAEDYDLMRRFVKAGLKSVHLDEALYMRRMQTGSQSRTPSIDRARNHFDVVSRVVATFDYEELFPDVNWSVIPAGGRELHAKYLIGTTYLSVGQLYIKTKQPTMARVAFEMGHKALAECVQADPGNSRIRELLKKCQTVHAMVSA